MAKAGTVFYRVKPDYQLPGPDRGHHPLLLSHRVFNLIESVIAGTVFLYQAVEQILPNKVGINDKGGFSGVLQWGCFRCLGHVCVPYSGALLHSGQRYFAMIQLPHECLRNFIRVSCESNMRRLSANMLGHFPNEQRQAELTHGPSMNNTAFRLTLPILFGYLPLGMAFGVLFTTQLEYPWWVAPLMGVTIYAGAGQILAVGMIAAGAGLAEVFVAMFVLNARHIFYGLSLLGHFRGAGWRKGYLIFGLTDETYSLLTTRPRSTDRQAEQRLDVRITLFNQLYWVLGCSLGALLGDTLVFDATGIEFALVALFIVLAIEQYKSLGAQWPLWTGALAAALSIAVLPTSQQLIGAVVLVAVTLLGQYALARLRHTQDRHHHG